ncbi:phosphoribosylglycinamide formyltransferase [Enterococcus sp. LJL99]
MRIAVLASGNGSNFDAIAKGIQSGEIKAELALLFCDRKDAYVIERAKKLNIPMVTFSPKCFGSKANYEAELLHLLEEERIDWVILAGYMRIIGPTLLEVYEKRIINIHPSLLPQFPGLHGIKDAFEANVSKTGVTIHYVDNGVDTGPIIAQEQIPIEPTDTLESLEVKIHKVEHELYPKTLARILN